MKIVYSGHEDRSMVFLARWYRSVNGRYVLQADQCTAALRQYLRRVGKSVVTSDPCNYVHGLRGEGLVWLIGTQHMPGCILRVQSPLRGQQAAPRCYSQCRSATTSTVVQHYWYCTSSQLTGAILNTRLLPLLWLQSASVLCLVILPAFLFPSFLHPSRPASGAVVSFDVRDAGVPPLYY